MNVYDCAHQLARAIKDSDEFKRYNKIKAEISQNIEVKEMLDDFQKKQLEIQTQQLFGNEVEEDKMQQIQQLYQIIVKDPKAAEYLQMEMSLSKMMADIYGIIGEVIKIV
ncbi:MAG: YlbF family regulator [Clostridiales bacterium]|nr:YlbF family regulator [Clostridiales bacterium]